MSSSAVSAAVRNCSRAPLRTNQRAACFAHSGRFRILLILSVPYLVIRLALLCLGQCKRMYYTVCTRHPHGHAGSTLGTWTAASHVLRLITSVRIRKSAVASAFNRSAYSVRGSCDHRVVHTAAGRRAGSLWTVASHCFRQVSSPHFWIRGTFPGIWGGRGGCLCDACVWCAYSRWSWFAYIHSLISCALSVACAANTSRSVRGRTYVTLAPRMYIHTVSATRAI
jgi:hypothetical protein